MVAELATFTLSAPISGDTSSTIDGGTVASPPRSSGRVLSANLQVVNGSYSMTFQAIDQSLQPLILTGAPPAAVLNPLLTWLQTLGQSKVTAVAPGTTITFSAG